MQSSTSAFAAAGCEGFERTAARRADDVTLTFADGTVPALVRAVEEDA